MRQTSALSKRAPGGQNDSDDLSGDTSELKIMKAGVCHTPGKFRIENVPVRAPSREQILVKVEGCGVCGSNLPIWEGRPWFSYPLEPGSPGHEGWGHVELVGADVKGVTAGYRVAFLSNHAFAEYELVQQDAAVVLPPQLNNIPFPGEPLGCAMNVFARADIRAGHTVAIVGIGFLGALLTALACRAGARVIAMSRRSYSLAVAKASGAHESILMNDHHATIDSVHKLTEEKGCDRVIEATGFQLPLDLAGEITRTRGKLIIAGYHQDGLRTVNMQLWNWRGIDVINAHERDHSAYTQGIRSAIEAVMSGLIQPESLYTHRFRLDELSSAFETMRNRPEGFIKALVVL